MVKGLLCDNNNDIEGYGLAWFSNDDDDTTFLKKDGRNHSNHDHYNYMEKYEMRNNISRKL